MVEFYGMQVPAFVMDAWRLIVAFLLALPIAYNRERRTRIMGLRTFPLVALASCAYVLVSQGFISPGADDAQARVLQGLITGIGFLGGGAILKGEDKVWGTATAATVWGTGAVGAAVAFDEYWVAILIAVASYLVLRFLTQVKDGVDEEVRREKHLKEEESRDPAGV